MPVKKISLLQGLSFSIGSIIGSGILFLPSLTLKQAGNEAFFGWLLIILLCIPGLYFFFHMISNNEEGIAGYVSSGINKQVGDTIPLLILGTVIIGMPSSAIIASKYVVSGLYDSPTLDLVLPYFMIVTTIFLSISGINTSSKINAILAILLISIGNILVFYPANSITNYRPLHEGNMNLSNVLSSAGLAFWAFAGFENLTFLTKYFRHPRRDFLIVSSSAVILCGLLYLGLTFVLYQLVPIKGIDSTTGLLQIADATKRAVVLRPTIAIFAFLAVMINLISWTAGVSNAMVISSKKGILPASLSFHQKEVPKNAIITLGILFLITITIAKIDSRFFETLLNIVSINFLIIYLLSIVSFFRLNRSRKSKAFAGIIIFGITAILIQNPTLLVYPSTLFLIGYAKSNKAKNYV